MIGARIRAARRDAGLSLRELARRVPLNPGYLSQIERGVRTPSDALRDDISVALGGIDLTAELEPIAPVRLSTETLADMSVILAAERRLDDRIGSAPLLASVVTQMRPIRGMVMEARGQLRSAALTLAAQWAEFTGWLHTATRRYDAAERWFGQSLEWAIEARDDDMVATVLSFKGHVAWLRGLPGATIAMSHAARRYRHVYAGQQAYDMLQEARGHALLGEAYAVDRLVDESHEMTERALRELPDAPPWHYYRSAAFWDLERGRALARLAGRQAQAADLLTAGLDALPLDQEAADWVAAYRQDLAACG